ncbi:unnamed protein product [Microthlaspi erraticum]|uniref:Uncharacterized protein n=1 Tax=Microthlaspi erraticum TaxID=1685480 RepID=A0A6D2HMV9_9BRAS|nr:unnamed protein product [Microthlaspi erraticum]
MKIEVLHRSVRICESAKDIVKTGELLHINDPECYYIRGAFMVRKVDLRAYSDVTRGQKSPQVVRGIFTELQEGSQLPYKSNGKDRFPASEFKSFMFQISFGTNVM